MLSKKELKKLQKIFEEGGFSQEGMRTYMYVQNEIKRKKELKEK